MRTLKRVLFAVVAACFVAGCSPVPTGESISSSQEALDQIREFGLTCEVQAFILGLDDAERESLARAVTEGMDTSDIYALADNREMGCGLSSGTGDGVTRQALWTGEIIEENNSGSSQIAPYFVGQDNPGAAVCGEDGNDWIGFYYRVYSYYWRTNLRLDGDTSAARCVINNSGNSARVYDTDYVVVCYGYWTVWLCGDEDDIYDAELWLI